MKLGFDDIAVEGFHDVFVGPRRNRACDVLDVVLGRAEDHLGRVAALLLAKRTRKAMPSMTGMFQSSSTTSGIDMRH